MYVCVYDGCSERCVSELKHVLRRAVSLTTVFLVLERSKKRAFKMVQLGGKK